MKIIKPLTLGVLHKPYQMGGRNFFVVSALGFFRLGAVNERFLSESLQWPFVTSSLPKGQPLDEVMPKQHAEVIVLGNAYTPGGQPCTELLVQLCMTDVSGTPSINKCLRITGNRNWSSSIFSTTHSSRATPFSAMPLDYEHAFGGSGHPENPLGRGYAGGRLSALFKRKSGAMPNISHINEPDYSPWQQRTPAGLGPQNITWAPRNKKLGTYNQAWLDHDAPGLARDIDWSVFNLAPPDQRAKGFFQGGENYCLHHLHPKKTQIEGKLPQFQARAFIQKIGQFGQTVSEVAMQMDTVWFLPEYELGIVVYHGQVEVQDSDALDVTSLMVAYEHSDTPKSLAHYQMVMALRLDPATAALHVFNESQLAADYSPEEKVRRCESQKQAENVDLAKRQEQLDLADAQFWLDQGSAPPPGYVVPRATPQEFGLVTTELVTEGDFDLAKTLEHANEICVSAEQQGQAALQKVAQIELVTRSAVSTNELIAAAIERGALPAYDLLVPDETGFDPQTATLSSALDAARTKGAFDDSATYAEAMAAVKKMSAQRREVRRASPTVTCPDLPLLPEVSLKLGVQIRQWKQEGICLAGRDLAGANLVGIDFSGADLRQIMLEEADLRDAKFVGANLQGAVLTGATLDSADFSHANLADANLSGSRGLSIRFQNTDLSRAQALSASWPKANLQAANLDKLLAVKLDLSGSVLNDASANQALLLEANADDSQWLRATLNQTVMLRASLKRADFSSAYLNKTVLIEAQMQASLWNNSRWDKLQATGNKTNWTNAILQGVQAKECGLHSAIFSQADLRGAQFLRCDFGQCDMHAAKMDDGIFSYSLFLQTNLRCASIQRADFFQALCRKTDFCGANLSNTSFSQCELTDSIGTDGKTERVRRQA
ncbi:DUF2169 domain-containing protein [Undibacterium sp. Xuan67W]|uniref:DUF2169 family type VI secretion system accessory protein n=1 Tax=Undibacterium sp. Xuan67W TaxID=3413057 RepID=UPI003BF2B51D